MGWSSGFVAAPGELKFTVFEGTVDELSGTKERKGITAQAFSLPGNTGVLIFLGLCIDSRYVLLLLNYTTAQLTFERLDLP